MKRLARWLAGLALVAQAHAVLADEPLPEPRTYEDVQHKSEFGAGYLVRSDVERNITTIARAGDGFKSDWSVPGWYRDVRIGKNGQSALLLTDDAPLAGSDDGDTAVFLFARKGEDPKPVTVEDMGLTDMPQTALHHLIYSSLSDGHHGWLVRLPDGKAITISFYDGNIDFIPSPRDLYEPGRQGFDHFFAEAREQLESGHCVTYRTFHDHSYSRSWRADPRFGIFVGPRFPIPRLPDEYMDGCLYALPDNQITDVTIYHRDAGARQPFDPVYDMPYFDAHGPLYGIIPIAASAGADSNAADDPGSDHITLTINHSPGVGTKDWAYETVWDSPVINPYDKDSADGAGVAYWRNLSLSSPMHSSEQLASMLESLRGRWAGNAREWGNTSKINRFTEMPEGIGYLEQVFADGGPQIVMAHRHGREVAGQLFIWESDAPFVCFAGTLDRDGLVVAGRSRVIAPLSDREFAVKKGEAIGLSQFGPMRPPPPEKVAHIEKFVPAETALANCRAALAD